ncbi:MAG TPA: AraC family transcriptional regulator ligand-binding domain-containing protein [Pseudomonadales bacterium]|nr:AraC family transcriptional regulator ligand-binding domain-containing protein [Pseudomonadales bacterium]
MPERSAMMLYPVTYFRLLARELKLDEAGKRELLAGTALKATDLDRFDRYLSEQECLELIRRAQTLTGRPDIGLLTGAKLSLAAHGPLGQLLYSSPTLADAWAALERFQVLRLPLVQMRSHFERKHYLIELTLPKPIDQVGLFLLEALAVTVQRGIELIIGRRLNDASILFGYPKPAHAERYAHFFPGAFKFTLHAANTNPHVIFRVPRELMEMANPFCDLLIWKQTLQHCENLEKSLKNDQNNGWRERIRQLLQQHPGKLWTLAEVADHFRLSTRTLMRHLKAEGTNYQSVLDAELEQQAKIYLKSPDHTVESVADALGYQDPSAFRRAFRRWCGMSPSAWLQRQQR